MFNLNVSLLKPVLILEDDPDCQHRILNILKNFGYIDSDLFFAQSLVNARDICTQHKFCLYLVDLGLPDGSGIDFIQTLRVELNTQSPVMVLSAWSTLEMIYSALEVGASGYALKERDDLEIMFAIRTILKGNAIIDTSIAREILKKMQCQPVEVVTAPFHLDHEAKLSNRESEVLNFIANGLSCREIAETLHISSFTVNVHIRNIYQKLNVNSRTKAVHTAKNIGLLS